MENRLSCRGIQDSAEIKVNQGEQLFSNEKLGLLPHGSVPLPTSQVEVHITERNKEQSQIPCI